MAEKMDDDSRLENELKTGKGLAMTLGGLDKTLWELDSLQNEVFEATLDARSGHGDRTAIKKSVNAARKYIVGNFEKMKGSISGYLTAGTISAVSFGEALSNLFTDNQILANYYNSLRIIVGGCVGYYCGPDPNRVAIYNINNILAVQGNMAVNAAWALGSLAVLVWSAKTTLKSILKIRRSESYFRDVWRKLLDYSEKLEESTENVPLYHRVQRP